MILILIIITILYTPLWAPPIILSPRKCRNLLPGQGVYLGPATPSKQDGDDNDDKVDKDDKDNDDKMMKMITVIKITMIKIMMIAMTMKISALVMETKILYFFMKNQCCRKNQNHNMRRCLI